MAYPQGINFRNTVGFIADVSPADCEEAPFGTHPLSYPRTTAQGNTVGWEQNFTTGGSRDRGTDVDARLAGIHFSNPGTAYDYRFDLPAPGDYNIRAAEGDHDNNRTMVAIEILDTAISLGNIINAGGGTLANEYFDASNTKRTAVAWPTDNVAALKTFTTTICRFHFPTGITVGIAHLYVETVPPTSILMGQICM